MKRTWMLRIAGILCIIAGAIVVVFVGAMVFVEVTSPVPSHADPIGYFVMIFFGGPSFILGTTAIVGGIYALRRRIWELVLAGSIALVVSSGYGLLPSFSSNLFVVSAIAGILSTLFVVLGEGEFKAKALVVDISPKSRHTTALLAFCLGVFGAHRFYVGKIGTAVVMLLLSIAGLGIAAWGIIQLGFLELLFGVYAFSILTAVGTWAFLDFIVAVTGNMTDKEGRLIKSGN